MRIELGFDTNYLAERAKKNKPYIFNISWYHDGTYFPEQNWSDFGTTILGWWTAAILKLAQGADSQEFDFMDGPFSLQAEYDRRTGLISLYPSKISKMKERELIRSGAIWTISFAELVKQIQIAVTKVSEELARHKLEFQGADKIVSLLETVVK